MVHNGLLGFGGTGSCPVWQEGHKPAHRGLHGGLGCEAGSGNIQFQFSELPLVENTHCRMDGQDRVKIVALPFHSVPIKIIAWLHSDEARFQKNADASQCSILGHVCCGRDSVVTGMAGMRFAILD